MKEWYLNEEELPKLRFSTYEAYSPINLTEMQDTIRKLQKMLENVTNEEENNSKKTKSMDYLRSTLKYHF